MERDYPDGIIHESDVILDVMFSNFSRRSIKMKVAYEFNTTRKVNPKHLKPENLYYYHKFRIFETVLDKARSGMAALAVMRRILESYDIDDDIYDISSLYREYTRYLNYRKSYKKAAAPIIQSAPAIITLEESDMAIIVAENIEVFYNQQGFDFSRYRQLEAYMASFTTWKVSRPSRTLSYQKKCFITLLSKTDSLKKSIQAVLS